MLNILKIDEETQLTGFSELNNNDWDELVELSVKCGVAGLVYFKLQSKVGDSDLPAKAMNELKLHAMNTALINMMYFRELRKVLLVLRQQDINPIILKGAYLAHSIYSDLSQRSMIDLDILLKKSQIEVAEQILLDMGYELDGDREDWKNNHFHYRYLHLVEGTNIELHWDLLEPNSNIQLDIDGIMQRSQSTTIAGIETLVFSPEDLLLHLCTHATVLHLFSYHVIRTLCDITYILRYYGSQIDWDKLREYAEKCGARKQVYLVLYFSRGLLNAPVSIEVLNLLKPVDLNQQILDWAEVRLWGEIENESTKMNGNPIMSDRMVDAFVEEEILSKVSVLMKKFFPARQELISLYSLPENSRIVYFYYPRRFVGLLLRHLRTMMLWLSRDFETLTLIEMERQRVALTNWFTTPG